MQFKHFGRSGLSVSCLCLGTGTFGHQTGEAEAFRILDAAADAGVNFIDTANIYPAGALAHEVGNSEEITGRWLKDKRGKFILGTKAGGPMGPSTWDKGASRKHLLDAIDASLRRLSTDYVDLYQIHTDDPTTPLDETAETLDLIVRSGRVRYIGASNFLAYRLARAIGRQDTLRLVRFVSVQPRYNLLFREIERELLPLAQEPATREQLRGLVDAASLGRARPYLQDAVLRRLFWGNLLQVRGAGEGAHLHWRCDIAREAAVAVLQA